MKFKKTFSFPITDNSVDVFIPEIWAKEAIALLHENMVAAKLVYRDFENEIRNYGETVHVAKPAGFTAKRKRKGEDVTVADVTATDVNVKLDQHIHQSFSIEDVDVSKSREDLFAKYLNPAVKAIASMLDKIILGQYVHFLGNYVGQLETSATKSTLVDALTKMDINKVPEEGRRLILNTQTAGDLIKLDDFMSAEKIGDDGTALRTASLGKILGFDTFKAQNMSVISTGNTLKTGAINNGAGYSKGDTTLTVDGFSGALVSGSYLTFEGDKTIYRISSHTEDTGGDTVQIVLTEGLHADIVDDKAIYVYAPGAVNYASDYAAGYDGEITVDSFTVAPRVGQLVAFGTATDVYTIIESSLTSLTLDRPLDAAISDDDAVCIGPAGNYNMAFVEEALALVVRPLALPPKMANVASSVSDWDGIGLRTTFSYLPKAQKTLCTLDLLAGIAVLDANRGAVILG